MQSLLILTSALLIFIGTLVTIKHWYYIEKNVQCHASSSSTKADFQHGVNYQLEPDKFLATISNCIQDSKCHIQYLHTNKTGGNTVEAYFGRIFNHSGPFHSCCHEKMMKRFKSNVHDHCVKEFNAYQVYGHDFDEIVQKCLVEYKNIESTTTTNSLVKDDNTSHRMVVLATFREPIQQSLSGIHQVCNKFWHKRSPEQQRACNNCSYEKDTEHWNNFVQKINKVFDSLYHDVILKVEKYEGVELLTIDNMDITPCFTKLIDWLPPPYSTRLEEWWQANEVRNPELLERCDFGYHSVMMKNLAPSTAIYRNMTLGR